MARIFKGDDDVSHSIDRCWIGVVTVYRLLEVLDQWHEAQWQYNPCLLTGRVNYDEREEKHAHVGAKYVRLDVGTSGAWMLEAETGIIYGIKGYGVADKKKVAGNINDPDFNGEVLFRDRFRHGRFDNRKEKSC